MTTEEQNKQIWETATHIAVHDDKLMKAQIRADILVEMAADYTRMAAEAKKELKSIKSENLVNFLKEKDNV